jgi:hypothetical protein
MAHTTAMAPYVVGTVTMLAYLRGKHTATYLSNDITARLNGDVIVVIIVGIRTSRHIKRVMNTKPTFSRDII